MLRLFKKRQHVKKSKPRVLLTKEEKREYKTQWMRDKRAEPEYRKKELARNKKYLVSVKKERKLYFWFRYRGIKITFTEIREMISNETTPI